VDKLLGDFQFVGVMEILVILPSGEYQHSAATMGGGMGVKGGLTKGHILVKRK
jgi:hypothetical protein